MGQSNGEQLAAITLPQDDGFGKLGLAQHLDYNTGNDYKKVQTAMPRKRRNVMTKSQVAPKTPTDGMHDRTGSRQPTHLPASIMNKIEQGKYMTDKDKVEQKRAEEERDAARIVNAMKDVEPFGEIPESAL